MKKIVGLIIAVVLVVGLAVGIREVVANRAADQPSTTAVKKTAKPASSSEAVKASSSAPTTNKRADSHQSQKKSRAATGKTTVSATKKANQPTVGKAAKNKSKPSARRPATKSARQNHVTNGTTKQPTRKKPAVKKTQATAQRAAAKPAKSKRHTTAIRKAYLKISGYKKQFYAGWQKITGKSTAFSLLMQAHLKVTYTRNPDIYVSAINGLKENDVRVGSGWMYSVNGKYVDKSAGEKRVKPGDHVHWYFSVDGYKP